MIKPGVRFKQFVELFLSECETRVVTRDKHDEYAQVLGAVLTFDPHYELPYERLAKFTEQLKKNHPFARVWIKGVSVRNPDAPDDAEPEEDWTLPAFQVHVLLFDRRVPGPG